MAKLLVAAANLTATTIKGDIGEVKPDSHVWGALETLPNWLQITITDKTDQQILHYLQRVVQSYKYTIDNTNAGGVRATIAVDEAFSGLFDKSIRADVADFILAGGSMGLTVVENDRTAESLTADIALPDDDTRLPTLKAFRDDINDLYAEVIAWRRWQFTESAVDQVIGMGGMWSGTAAQADNFLLDKFTVSPTVRGKGRKK